MVLASARTSSDRISGLVAGHLDPVRAEEALRQSEDRYRLLVETMMDGFAYCQMLYDEEGRPVDWIYLAVNSAFVVLTGLENVVGERATDAIPGIKDSSPELFEIYGRVAAGEGPERFTIDVAALSICLNIAVSSPAPGYFVAVFENITPRKKMEAALEEASRRLKQTNRELVKARDAAVLQSRTDSLTGCLNRRSVLAELYEEMERAKRKGGSLTLGMIDVDDFKHINDTFGHPAGDGVLCEVASRCLDALRPYDVFGRLGGDEFLVVISSVDEDQARSALERIREAIAAAPVSYEGQQISVTVSVGGVLWRAGSATDLIRMADEVLYQAKTGGRNRLVMQDGEQLA